MTGNTSVILVTGGTAQTRETAIIEMIAASNIVSNAINTSGSGNTIGIILEGIPNGTDSFAAPPSTFPTLTIARIAPGCPCCTGNLTMRVTLNRILRAAPKKLYISLATDIHLDQIRGFLAQPPYDKLIKIAKDLSI